MRAFTKYLKSVAALLIMHVMSSTMLFPICSISSFVAIKTKFRLLSTISWKREKAIMRETVLSFMDG